MHTKELLDPPAPDTPEVDSPEAMLAMGQAIFPLRFRIRGPGQLRNTGLVRRTTSDGVAGVETKFAFSWIEAAQHAGATREQVREWLTFVFQHSSSWVRAGVWFPRAENPGAAQVIITYVANGNPSLRCGSVRNAAGCTRHPPGRPATIAMDQDLLGRPPALGISKGIQKGILHELAHAAFHAIHKGSPSILSKTPEGKPTTSSRFPTFNDIQSVIAYTRGRNQVGRS
jgi:hypothetical protein